MNSLMEPGVRLIKLSYSIYKARSSGSLFGSILRRQDGEFGEKLRYTRIYDIFMQLPNNGLIDVVQDGDANKSRTQS